MQILSISISLAIIKITMSLDTSELLFIVKHLSKSECHQLVVSLQSKSFELPTPIPKTLPRNIPCINLLETWNNETPDDKTQEIERRLRQLGKESLANWLGYTVFHQLVKEINDSLLHPSNKTEERLPSFKLHKDQDRQYIDNDEWYKIDTILWVWVVVLVAATIYFCCCFLFCSEKKQKKSKIDEQEMVTLLNNDYDFDE